MKKQIFYLIISVASVVLAYGKPIEIKGFMAVGLWIVPFLFMIFCIKNNARLFRGLFVTTLILYNIATGLFLIRDRFFGDKHEFFPSTEGRKCAEISYSGSLMTDDHLVVYRREYFSLIENTGVLSVRVLLSEETKYYHPQG
ncbi:MAG: hypothetical protein K2J77_11740 [Oscillospiraceae bacterium]|nr:hypothetical protein [Oscillospiraceae bacterium]